MLPDISEATWKSLSKSTGISVQKLQKIYNRKKDISLINTIILTELEYKKNLKKDEEEHTKLIQKLAEFNAHLQQIPSIVTNYEELSYD